MDTKIQIVKEIRKALESMDCKTEEVEIIHKITKANRIFLAGCGRTGYIIKCFAIRLMQLGFNVYVIGDTITQSATKGDLLILGSGSGETGSLVSYANKAKKLGMELVLFSTCNNNTLSKMADTVVSINAVTKNEIKNENLSIQPMGSLFEQTLIIWLDSLIIKIMESNHISSDKMYGHHANLE